MASGLVLRIESGSHWEWDEVDIKEDFEDLELEDKYAFALGWYTALDGKIHIVWRYISDYEIQIYLCDNIVDASQIFRRLTTEQLDEVDEEDKKKMLTVLEKYGGPLRAEH
jgi:hypothetical protein